MQLNRRSSRGMAIAFVLMTLFILTVLGFAFGSRGTLALNQVYITRQYVQAFYAAQAGIMLAIEAEQQSDIHLPTACGGIVSSLSPLPAGATLLSALQGLNLPYSLDDNASFSVTITNNTAAPINCSSTATAPDGTAVPAGYVYISSQGKAYGRTKTSSVMVPVTPGTPPVDFNYAVFAQTTINFSNNESTDSYNSAYGSYNCSCGGVACTCPSGHNLGSKGNIGTNSNAKGAVTLSNNVTVKGEVDVGPGGHAGSPTISASNGSTYSKAVVLSAPVTFPPVTVPPPLAPGGPDFTCVNGANCLLAANTPYNNITVSNLATLTVGCGNYSMNSINLSNNATLTINCSSGSANFYVYGTNAPGSSPINFSNGTILNTPGVPSAFQLYDLSSATGCNGSRCSDNLSNNGALTAAFYAPNSIVNVSNNGGIYGSLIAYSAPITNNALVHYDQALAKVPIGASTNAVVGNFTVWNFQ